MRAPRPLASGRVWGLAIVAALALFQGAAAGGAALATRSLFDEMRGHAGVGALTALGPLAALIAAGVAIAAARVAFGVIGERFGQRYALEIRDALFAHAAAMSASDVAARRAGYMSLRFVGDMAAFKSWVALGMPRIVAAIIQIPAAILVLWSLAPEFGLIGGAVFAIGVAAILLLGRGLTDRHMTLRARRARIAAEMAERMPMAPDLRRLGRARMERRRLTKMGADMIGAALGQVRRTETLKAVADIAAGVAAACVIWAAIAHGASPGAAAGALAAIAIGAAALRDLASAWDMRAAFGAAFEKLEVALNRRTRPRRSGPKASLPKGPLSVCVKRVAIGTARDFECAVEPGDRAHIATTGGSEASAVLSAIAGRDALDEGEIRIGGAPLAEISPAALRDRVAHLTADPPILRGSLRRALTLGLTRRPSDASILRAARATGLDGLVERLGGLDGSINEGGRGLTAMERWRIAVARAYLQRPSLVLIDRSASIRDDAAETSLFERLKKKGVTILMAG